MSHNIGDTDNDRVFDVGETWRNTAAYTVTQADIDGAYAGDGDIDNVATGDTAQTDPDSDNETVPIVYRPSINVTKDVSSITDGSDYGASGQVDSAGDVINYDLRIQNTGNVALSGVTMVDEVE